MFGRVRRGRTCAALLALGVAAALPARISRAILRRGFAVVGTALTLGLSKHKWTAGAWSRTGEPLLINALQNIIFGVQNGLIPALLSDAIPARH